MIDRHLVGGLALTMLAQPAWAIDVRARADLEPLIVKHAAANNVPAALVHRIIIRESRYNARAVGRGGAMGLMQIKHATARALGYGGPAAGLLDPDVNLTYGVRYLAGAYRVANGDQNQTVGFYARGYYYDAKRRGMLGALKKAPAVTQEPAPAAAAPQPEQPVSIFSVLFPPSRPPQPAEAVKAAEEAQEPAAAQPSGRSTKRRAARAPTPKAPALGEPGEGVQPAEAVSEAPLRTTRRSRSVLRKPPADPSAGAMNSPEAAASAEDPSAEQASAAATRNGRSARRSATSGAARSARKASAQPDDPDKHP